MTATAPYARPTSKLEWLRSAFVNTRRQAAAETDADLRAALVAARDALETAGKLAALVWKEDEL